MRHKFDNLKDEEKLFTTFYMKYKYNYIPTYLDTGLNIPDCYFEYKNKKYAIEATRYFQQNSEKEHQQYVRDVEKYLKDDFFSQVYNRLGKKKSQDVTISFYNADELKLMIVDNINYIKYISIGNNFYINDKKELLGEVFCSGNNKEKMTIEEFIQYVSELIYEEETVDLNLFTKNKYEVSISFKYCKSPYYGNDNNKKAIPMFCWFENKKELYENIIDRIILKNEKLINEYIPKLRQHKIKFNYYNLVVYYEGYPASPDEEILYNEIKKINNLKYQEIAIFLWNKIMVVNKTGYQIFDTSNEPQ